MNTASELFSPYAASFNYSSLHAILGPPRRWKVVVKTQNGHPAPPRSLGLHVGIRNARQYFPRHSNAVELHMDHLVIVCTLPPAFWDAKPEIFDERLSSWLHSKRDSGKLSNQPSPITLIPNGEGSFRILLMREDRKDPLRMGPSAQVTKVEVLGPVVVPRPAPVEESTLAAIPHQPVATLKGHDQPALAANY